jgi:hypothetical protein
MSKHYATERAYLASLNPPLAKENARGRFSREAKAALITARYNVITFGEGADSQGNSSPAAANAAAGPSQALGDIRTWARANGYDIGVRGRIPSDVLKAYNGEVQEVKPDPWLAKPAPHQPRLRQLDCLYGLTEEGYRVGFSTCRRCMSHLSRCACKQGPMPPSIVVKVLDQTTV